MSNGSLKLANKKWTSIPNDYCISFFENTEFREVAEDTTISQDAYSFKKINTLIDLQPQSTIDVIGVILEVGILGSITVKASGNQRDRRSIVIADDS